MSEVFLFDGLSFVSTILLFPQLLLVGGFDVRRTNVNSMIGWNHVACLRSRLQSAFCVCIRSHSFARLQMALKKLPRPKPRPAQPAADRSVVSGAHARSASNRGGDSDDADADDTPLIASPQRGGKQTTPIVKKEVRGLQNPKEPQQKKKRKVAVCVMCRQSSTTKKWAEVEQVGSVCTPVGERCLSCDRVWAKCFPFLTFEELTEKYLIRVGT